MTDSARDRRRASHLRYANQPGMRAILAEKARKYYWAKHGEPGCKGKKAWRDNHADRLYTAEQEAQNSFG